MSARPVQPTTLWRTLCEILRRGKSGSGENTQPRAFLINVYDPILLLITIHAAPLPTPRSALNHARRSILYLQPWGSHYARFGRYTQRSTKQGIQAGPFRSLISFVEDKYSFMAMTSLPRGDKPEMVGTVDTVENCTSSIRSWPVPRSLVIGLPADNCFKFVCNEILPRMLASCNPVGAIR